MSGCGLGVVSGCTASEFAAALLPHFRLYVRLIRVYLRLLARKATSMLRSIRKWIHASRVRRIAAGAAGVAMLAIGALLAFNALTAPTLPDPRTATEAEVIAFLKDDYHRASSAQREALIQGLAQQIGRAHV